jgi:hypothetical protein
METFPRLRLTIARVLPLGWLQRPLSGRGGATPIGCTGK